VLSEGAAVLNAADAQVVKLAELSDGGVIFYAQDENNEVLIRHRAEGGRVVFLRDQPHRAGRRAEKKRRCWACPSSSPPPPRSRKPCWPPPPPAGRWTCRPT
jgi:hypothetical protein